MRRRGGCTTPAGTFADESTGCAVSAADWGHGHGTMAGRSRSGRAVPGRGAFVTAWAHAKVASAAASESPDLRMDIVRTIPFA
jgi:hypothetical protein